MSYFKDIDGNYIIGVGIGDTDNAIAETEYDEILNAIRNKPQATATKDYRLKTDLTWEEVAVEPQPEDDPEYDYEKAYNTLTGDTNE